MSARRAGTARRITHPTAPRGPRRISGPVRTPARSVTPAANLTAATVALPAPGRAGVAAGTLTPRLPNPLQRLRAVPDARVLDRLVRSNAWIWLIGVALGGIVAMQVSLLKLNAGISRAVESSATLERQNAELEIEVARLSSEERIRAAALRAGLIPADAGSVGFLTARGDHDVDAALRAMKAPGVGVAPPVTTGQPHGTALAATGQSAAPIQAQVSAPPAATAAPAVTAAPAAPTTTTTTTTADSQAATAGGATPPTP